MDNYRGEIKNEMAGKITNNSDSKQIKMKLSPIKNSSEDSPLRRALEQPPLKRFKVNTKMFIKLRSVRLIPGCKDSRCRDHN